LLVKPLDVFDRDWEWEQLVRFATSDRPGATLGVVSGRRRQGKTYLLEALCEATGGFFFAATEALPRAEALRQLGEAVAEFQGQPGSVRYDDWAQAVDGLLALSSEKAVPVVLDEFPYMVRDAPELPSTIQRALSPRRPQRRDSRARLLLCGSSMTFMGRLLTGSAPLRGRSSLELMVRTFDFRLARRFWGVDDHRLAALLYFVVGGTPAYRGEYLPDVRVDDFDAFVVDHVLSPASPLFREVRALLAEDPSLSETGLYHTVLAAVAEGNTTRGGIASRLERKATDISHHLTVLEDSGLLRHEPDAFRSNRSQYQIVEPLVRFHHAIMRPHWTQLERARPGRAARIWEHRRPTFSGQVAGPTFERMCRLWAQDFAGPDTLGGEPSDARSGVVYDSARRVAHEVDVVVNGNEGELLAIGEVKWGETMDAHHLARLAHIADLLEDRGRRPGKLLLFSGAGFTDELRGSAGSDPRVELVDLRRLYEGE
jgi:AAA+ ATPase superfamily predicted ATPase